MSKEFFSSSLIGKINIFAIFSCFFLSLLSGLAAVFDGQGWLFLLTICFALAGLYYYWIWLNRLVWLKISGQTITFKTTQEYKVAIEELKSLQQNRFWIQIESVHGIIRLAKFFIQEDARLYADFQALLPNHTVPAEFPVIVSGRGRSLISMLIIAGILILFGSASVFYALVSGAMPEQVWISALVGLLSLLSGALFVWIILSEYIRYTEFLPDTMTHYFFRSSRQYELKRLHSIRTGFEARPVKGIERRIYYLEFVLENQHSIRWFPDEFSFPMDYIDAHAQTQVENLCAQLMRLYQCQTH